MSVSVGLSDGLLVWHTYRGLQVALREQKVVVSFSLTPIHQNLPERRLYPFLVRPDFAAAAQTHLCVAWLSGQPGLKSRIYKTLTNEKRVLKQPSPPGDSKRQQAQALNVLGKRQISLSFL